MSLLTSAVALGITCLQPDHRIAKERRLKLKFVASIVCLISLGAFALERNSFSQTQLNVSYGANGIQRLSYRGTVLEDLAQYPADAFHIWHMKVTDLQGNVLPNGQYGWGETNQNRTWDSATNTWTYKFAWGMIQVGFVQTGDTLDLNVTETNNANSGVVLDGAVIYPLALHFPQVPAGFYNASYPQLTFNTTAPSVTVADYGAGEVMAVAPDASKPLYSGFWPVGSGVAYYPMISGTTPDNLATFQPHNDRPVQPGQTDKFTVSLRFAPSGTPSTSLAADAYRSWASTWPPQLNWTDRRAIGTVFLSSSAAGNSSQASGYPNNPRRYFNNSDPNVFDLKTAPGLAAFQAKVLQQAQNNVVNLRNLGAQGAITWDIEGQQFPQSTSYVCQPDDIASIAPEMETSVSDRNSRYFGLKLDDAYFKTMTDAGFRVGVCIRPQHFTLNSDGTAQQVYLPNASVGDEMIRKMKFAHDRWGATLFYVDSSVEPNGAVLDAGIFQRVAQNFPDSLIIPEESTPKHYAYTAPFQTFIFHGDLGTDPTIRAYYPSAFSANLINDADPVALASNLPQLTASVRSGDILMGHAGYWQANDPTIVAIYQAAGVGGPITVPAPVTVPVTIPAPLPTPAPVTTPVVTPAPLPNPAPYSAVSLSYPQDGSTVNKTIDVTAQVNVSLDAAGSYLLVDGVQVGTARINAAPYKYSLDTTLLSNGVHTLQIWAHDTGNTTWLSNSVAVTVANTSAPVAVLPVPVLNVPFPITLSYPAAGQAVSGVLQVAGQIAQTLDAAGSYLMVDGVEAGSRRVSSSPFLYVLDTTTLSNGLHTLQLWAHDTGNNNLLSNPVTITVGN